MDPNLAQQHDDVYAAVFSLVGQKPNETYEGLVKVLPSIKDADPAELKELEARKALREMMAPSVDPLRLEYEKAAAEEDVDDLSTEDGDWLDVSKNEEDAQELDENGIPIVKLSRASSSFILDGPGDVKVDNFTPEVDQLAGKDGEATAGAKAAGETTDRTSGGAAATSTAVAANASYVPSVIARAMKEPSAGGASASGNGATATAQGASISCVRGAGPAAAASAAASAAAAAAVDTPATSAPVMTLEDEIRAMRGCAISPTHLPAAAAGRLGAPAAAVTATPASANPPRGHPGEPQGQQRSNGSCHVGEDTEDDAPEVVPEPSGTLIPRGGCSGSANEGSTSGSGMATLPGVMVGGAEDEDGPSAAMRVRPDMGVDETAVPSLPGTCQDTRSEDALWAMMHGIDGRALLEHMGLAAGQSEDLGSEEATTGTAEQRSQDGAEAAPAVGNGHVDAAPPRTGLANGHVDKDASGGGDDSGEDVTESPNGAATGTADAGGAALALGASNADGTAAAGLDAALVAAPNGDRSLQPHQPQPSQLQPVTSSSSDGPTFEAVESFSLDPDFDYDNVTLTVREFPYSLLNFPVRR